MRIGQWMGAAVMGLLVSAAGSAQAEKPAQECSAETLEQAGDYLREENFVLRVDNGVVVAAACKRWPGKNGLVLGVFAYEGKREDVKDLAILVIDEKKGKVLSAHRSMIEEDASMRVEEGSLRLDTAAYDLAPGVRAFGVDVESGYIAHCAQGGAGANRTLYVMDGARLRPVMKDMATTAWRYDDNKSSTCSQEPGDVVNYTLTLSVDKAVTKGYADLLVTAVGRYEDGKRTKRAPFSYRMRYDGKQYPAEVMMGEFWTWRN